MESPVAIDPTTSSSPSSCDNLDYVPAAYALVSIARADHGVTGHSPARDIINPRVPEKELSRAGFRCDDSQGHLRAHRVRRKFQWSRPMPGTHSETRRACPGRNGGFGPVSLPIFQAGGRALAICDEGLLSFMVGLLFERPPSCGGRQPAP
jgi:hypothetical protein